jgi:glucose-6-phosphate isomerase
MKTKFPMSQTLLDEVTQFSGLPIAPSSPIAEAAAISRHAIPASCLHRISFERPIFRRVERTGEGQERQTGWLAFENVDRDADVRKLRVYDASYFDGCLRQGSTMEDVLADPESRYEVGPVAYSMFRGLFATKEHITKAFYDNKVRFDITIIPPATWGKEFAKTYGHYHGPPEKPEIYQVLSGKVLWLMQKCDRYGNLEQFIPVEARAGEIVIMLPDYGHVSVNTSTTDPLVLANWITWHQSPVYAPFRQKHGAAYYVFNRDGEPHLEPNPNYRLPRDLPTPPFRRSKGDLPAFGLVHGKPIYGLVELPADEFSERIGFLCHPDEYRDYLVPHMLLT